MSGQRKPEWVRQAWIHKFLERVVLEPCEVRGFDQANKAKESVGSRMAAIGRGLKGGTPDHWVWQLHHEGWANCVSFEIKHKSKPSPAQVITADSLERCGVYVVRECQTIQDALNGLKRRAIRLHGNTTNIAAEMQQRMDAGLRALDERKKLSKTARGEPSHGGRYDDYFSD